MEDYLTMVEFEKLTNPDKQEAKPIKITPKTDYIAILGKFIKGMAIILRLIGFGLSKAFKALYNGLLKLNERMDEVRKSEFGKRLKEQQINQPKWGLRPPQDTFNLMNQPKNEKPKKKMMFY